MKLGSRWLIVAALAVVSLSSVANALVIYSDTFTAANGTALVGRAPEVDNALPTAVYAQHNGSWEKDIQGNQARIGADAGVSLPVAGLNIGPARPLHISAMLNINDIAGPATPANTGVQRGLGLGFYTSAGGNATSAGWRGLEIGTDGRLILSQEGVAGSSRAGFVAEVATGLNLAVPHSLSYDIDQVTGDISNIMLDNVLQPDITTNIFTAAAVQRAGIMASSSVGSRVAFFDDLVVEAPNLEPIPGLFNTGVDDNGVVLAGAANDPHYNLTINPNGANNIPAVVETNIPGAWIANNTLSKWVGPVANTNDIDTGGNFDYTLTFSLKGLEPDTAYLQGSWAADNPGAGTDILINGVSTGQTAASFGSFTAFTITSGFQDGINTLTFRVPNGSAAGDFTGLRVQGLVGFAITHPIPEPATATLGLLSLTGLLMRRRQRCGRLA